ncbi:class I SAM-dependent methyltransferase [Alkalithermobacter thermoalcaliphilus]
MYTDEYISINGSICPSKKENNIYNFLKVINPSVGEKVLLVGDIGNYGKYLNKLGVEVTIFWIEKEIDTLALAKNCSCNVIKGNLEYMPFKDEYFDKVIFLNAFNSFDDEQRVFDEICRVLRKNGNIVIQERDPKSLEVRLTTLKRKTLGYKCKFYYPNEIDSVMQKMDV